MDFEKIVRAIYEMDSIRFFFTTNGLKGSNIPMEIGSVNEYENGIEIMLEDDGALRLDKGMIGNVSYTDDTIYIELTDGNQVQFEKEL